MKRNRILAGIIVAMLLCTGVLCGCEEDIETFYTLQEAYETGYLTREDIMSIAYYHNGGRVYNEGIMSEGYTPIPKTPQELSEDTVNKIKETAADEYNSQHDLSTKATADGFTIIQYYGTYNNCIAIMMRDIYTGHADAIRTEEIAEITLYYNNGNKIKIWKRSNK